MTAENAVLAATEVPAAAPCTAVLNLAGAHFQCDGEEGHLWAHNSVAAQAIWANRQEIEAMEGVARQMSEMGH